MTRREIVLVLCALLASAPAVAQKCPQVVGRESFEKSGGKLTKQEQPVIRSGLMPAGFFCDRVACHGAVTFAGIVGTDGRPRHLTVVENTWTARPVFHAKASRWIVSHWRYQKPVLDGRPVCVKRTWRLDFRPKAKAEE